MCCSSMFNIFVAFYISLRRHRAENTYGMAPMIVVTRERGGRRKSSHKTMETTLYSDSRYSTCDGMSVSAAQSDWSINTSVNNTADEREDKSTLKPS